MIDRILNLLNVGLPQFWRISYILFLVLFMFNNVVSPYILDHQIEYSKTTKNCCEKESSSELEEVDMDDYTSLSINYHFNDLENYPIAAGPTSGWSNSLLVILTPPPELG